MTGPEPPVGRGGAPRALTPLQVEIVRRRRRRRHPKALKPSLAALAAEFQVSTRTITRALRGVPPYDFKAGKEDPQPATRQTALHRDRERGGHGRKRDDVPRG